MSRDYSTCAITTTQQSVYVAWRSTDTDTFTDIKSLFKAAFPAAHWDTEMRAWGLPAGARVAVLNWARRNFDQDSITIEEASWLDDDEDDEREGGDTLLGAYATLYLRPGAPLAIAEAVYRVMSKRAHPDAGGDTAAMAAINAAIEVIRERA